MRKNRRGWTALLAAMFLLASAAEVFAGNAGPGQTLGPGQGGNGSPGSTGPAGTGTNAYGTGTNAYSAGTYGPSGTNTYSAGNYGPGGTNTYGTSANEAYWYGPGNVGPGYNPPENNPAYDTGWNSGIGPGNVGNNPMGNQPQTEEDAFSGGPNSEKAKKYLEQEANTMYIYGTYRGGVWEKLEDGRWKLKTPEGHPVSSQWAVVDGKTYLLDMYGIMQTGFKRVNDNWYYFNSVGAMQTGWLLKEGKYYFLNADGAMAYGWVNSQGLWYFLDKETGAMLTNVYTPDGRYVNAEGVMVS